MGEARFQGRLNDVKADRRHRAAELARLSLQILSESAKTAEVGCGPALKQTLLKRADRLIQARPSMVAIGNLLGLFKERLGLAPDGNLAAFRAFAAAQANALIHESETAASQAAAHAAAALGERSVVFTHSLSSTVLYVFQDLKELGVRAIVTESRPLFEGELYTKVTKIS